MNLKALHTARNPGVRAQQTKEVLEMAASRFIEEESGTFTPRFRRRHNGYYAGDFSPAPLTVPALRLTFLRPEAFSSARTGTPLPPL